MNEWKCALELPCDVEGFAKRLSGSGNNILLISLDSMFTVVTIEWCKDNGKDIKILAFGHSKDMPTLWVDLPSVKYLR